MAEEFSARPLVYVYLAGPYRVPDPVSNTAKAIDWAEEVAALGYVPIIPHETLLWQMKYQHDDEYWLLRGQNLLRICDVLFRYSRDFSKGADLEQALAVTLGIPVVYSKAELLAKYPSFPR